MYRAAIVTLVFATLIRPMQAYQVENESCSPVHPHFPAISVNLDFFNIATWYIYAHSNPHPDYMSIFHIPLGLTQSPRCLRLFSETNRGLIRLRYNCPTYGEIYKLTLYSTNFGRRRYRQVYRHRLIYKKYRPFAEVQVVASDCYRYVVFAGCQQLKNRALIGLLFLVRAEVYDHFVPPVDLIAKLKQHFAFNLTHQLAAEAQSCDCKAAARLNYNEIAQIHIKEKEKEKLRVRVREQFAKGIRNFFICVLAFALGMLIVAKLIDMYVFDIENTMNYDWRFTHTGRIASTE